MVFRIVLLCLMAFATADCLVGGRDAKEDELPYQVMVRFQGFNSTNRCGGALIDPQWVLTSASCIENGTIIVSTGKLASHTVDKNERNYTVTKTFKHEKYTRNPGPFDIAVMKLNESVKLDDHVKTIALPESNSEPTGKVTFSGYGLVGNGVEKIFSEVLQVAEFNVLKVEPCINKWNESDPDHEVDPVKSLLNEQTDLCLDPESNRSEGKPGKVGCGGDIGSPVTSTKTDGKKELIGLATWAEMAPECSGYYPTTITKVSAFIDWIRDKISAN